MCGQCRGATPVGVEWFTTGHAESLRERRVARATVAATLTRLGRERRLVVSAPPGLLAWQVLGPTGRAQTAGTFAEVLSAFSAAWGGAMDPLDDAVIKALEGANP